LALWEDFSWESYSDEYSIWDDSMTDKKDYNAFLLDEKYKFVKCKVCGVKYIGDVGYPAIHVNKFIENIIGLPLQKVDNIVEHGKRLALISRKMQKQKEKYSPLRAFLIALIEARSF